MKMQSIDILGKYHQLTESVEKNLHFLNRCNPKEIDINSLISFNNRLLISDCKVFLEAVKKEIGGEIIEDSKIGSFLYYGETTS
jgi:hypothetical protein